MFALVQWIEDKKVTVVRDDLIIGDRIEGEIIEVKYGGKPHQGKILRLSESKLYLEGLRVMKDGSVSNKAKKSKKTEADKELASESRVVSKKRKSLAEQRNEALGDYVYKAKKPHKESKQNNTKDLFAMSATSKNAGTASNEGTSKDQSDSDSELPLSSLVTDHAPKMSENNKANNECEMCNMCPEVDASNLNFLQNFTKYVASVHAYQLQKKLNTSSTEPDSSRSLNEKQLSDINAFLGSQTEIELQPGSGILVGREWLTDLKRDWKHEPKEMARRLHKLLLGGKQLAKMSATGEGYYEAIPTAYKDAIQYWIDRNCKPNKKLTASEYNRCLNLMCGTIRKFLKGPKDNSSKSPEGGPSSKSSSKKDPAKPKKKVDDKAGQDTPLYFLQNSPRKMQQEDNCVNFNNSVSHGNEILGLNSYKPGHVSVKRHLTDDLDFVLTDMPPMNPQNCRASVTDTSEVRTKEGMASTSAIASGSGQQDHQSKLTAEGQVFPPSLNSEVFQSMSRFLQTIQQQLPQNSPQENQSAAIAQTLINFFASHQSSNLN